MNMTEIPDDWWPSCLSEFAAEEPLRGEHVVVAEVSRPWMPCDKRILYTCLIPKDRAEALEGYRGSIGFECVSSGPWPFPPDGDYSYVPDFWVDGVEREEKFEPLVISWKSAGVTILLPDQGFLMTYGLISRQCEFGEVYWDDPCNNVFDVVKVEPHSELQHRPNTSHRVLIRRTYLEDYATLRNMCLAQVYFVEKHTESPDAISQQLADIGPTRFALLNREFDIRRRLGGNGILAQVWGFRHIIDPGSAPVSEDNDYGVLVWPGFGVVDGTRETDIDERIVQSSFVYVKDSVLAEYEGKSGFSIHPESGGVSYGDRWSVGLTSRIGRDLIQLSLWDLYKMTRPNTVRTWNNHCVDPPRVDDLDELRREPNVATRAKNIVYSMAELGEVLAEIARRACGSKQTGKELVRLDRRDLDYSGWWKADGVEPITRHAPLEMKEHDFMARCVDLYKIIGERLPEKLLRNMLTKKMGYSEDDLKKKEVGSLNLLDRLVQMAMCAGETGLNLINHAEQIRERISENAQPTPVQVLFDLSALRNRHSHAGRGKDADVLKKALQGLGICRQKMQPGWGIGVDIVYDRTAESLEEISTIFRRALSRE